jgi:gliding motility-associated-like protein
MADTLKGCAPVCVQFTDTSKIGGGKITGWSWNFGDGGTDNVQNPNHCYNTPGVYTVILTVTSDSGCTSTLTINNMISIYSKPKADFILSPQPTTIMAPTIYFTDKSTDINGITTWLWTFGDLTDSISAIRNPVHTYGDTGTYCATLRVANAHGCSDSITQCLVIDPQYTLYIPDAFTPNSNGLNDVFMAKGEALKSFDMYVFDRWGLLLFHSSDINKGWNGKYGKHDCQEDTYVYLINIHDNYDKKHSYIGKVTLLK